jgi:hypothetical protein
MACRWLNVAPRYTAERTSGWWNRMRLGDAHQPSRLCHLERLHAGAKRAPCAEDDRRIAGLLGRYRKEQRLGRVRQATDPFEEHLLDAGADRQRVGKRGPTGELVGVQRRRQLEQRQWIALGGRDQAVTDVRREPGWESFGQQHAGGVGVQSCEVKLLDTRRRERMDVVVADGDQAHNSLGLEPSGSEGECVSRRMVQPLRIVHQADQGPLLGDLREQTQDAHTNQEAVGALGGGEPEGTLQGGRLGTWKPLDMVEHGPDELMQGRERQLRLRLDAGPPQHPHPPAGTVGGVGEQRRLAHTNLAANHQRAAALPARIGEQAVDRCALLMAAVKHGSMVAPGDAGPATAPATGG